MLNCLIDLSFISLLEQSIEQGFETESLVPRPLKDLTKQISLRSVAKKDICNGKRKLPLFEKSLLFCFEAFLFCGVLKVKNLCFLYSGNHCFYLLFILFL